MYIKEIISQSRRDLEVIYKCEFCWEEHEWSWYDDDNFHINVIPNFTCDKCWKKSWKAFNPRETKYEEWFII